jgi:hypothetical protein
VCRTSLKKIAAAEALIVAKAQMVVEVTDSASSGTTIGRAETALPGAAVPMVEMMVMAGIQGEEVGGLALLHMAVAAKTRTGEGVLARMADRGPNLSLTSPVAMAQTCQTCR